MASSAYGYVSRGSSTPGTRGPNTAVNPLKWVPLRQDPEAEDSADPERLQFVLNRWHSQDAAYVGFARMVEENIRCLSGRQWDVWSDLLNRFIDSLQFMHDDERRFRQRPVVDWLGYWFQLTLSKATENPPVISFLPANADRLSAMLASVMDPIWKIIFDDGEMDQRLMRATAWALVAGECFVHTRVEFGDGPQAELIHPAVLTLTRPDGTSIERTADAVPYDQMGNPLAQLQEDPNNPGEYGYDITGEPWVNREGCPEFDVLCPLEIRSQWGQHVPWRAKRWVMQRWFHTPAEVERMYGIHCEPDTYPSNDDQGPGYLERMLFGSGYFGAVRNDPRGQFADTTQKAREGYVMGYTMWEKPDPQHTPSDYENGEAGGRLLITSRTKVLWDSVRPFCCECAGPIRRMQYIDIPGRPFASTPLEKLVPMQKRLNRIEAQIAEHTNLVTNPVLLVHDAAGIDDDEWIARPGTVIPHGYNGPGRAAEWLAPPMLSGDVWREKDAIRQQLFTIGSMTGSEAGPAPTANASGELVEQLRFNADRPLAPLTRNIVITMADVAEDVLAILPVIWPEEKVITYAGKDSVVRSVTVLPEMWKGRVNVRPSIESAAAETKARKQERLIQLYQLGVWGNILDPMQQPKAAAQLLELLNYPDMERATRPGGVDRVMAEQNLGRLVRGDPAQQIPILEVYDLGVHLAVTTNFMKTPEYLQLDPAIQQNFMLYLELLQAANTQAQLNQLARAEPVAHAQAAFQGAQASTLAAHGPQPAPPDGGGNGGPPEPGPAQAPKPAPNVPRPPSRAT